MLVGTTCAVLAGTLIVAIVLFGRFVILVGGFFLGGTALITLHDAFLSGPQSVAALAVALILIVIARPDFARRKRLRT